MDSTLQDGDSPRGKSSAKRVSHINFVDDNVLIHLESIPSDVNDDICRVHRLNCDERVRFCPANWLLVKKLAFDRDLRRKVPQSCRNDWVSRSSLGKIRFGPQNGDDGGWTEEEFRKRWHETVTDHMFWYLRVVESLRKLIVAQLDKKFHAIA